jgi:hypothetical protein
LKALWEKQLVVGVASRESQGAISKKPKSLDKPERRVCLFEIPRMTNAERHGDFSRGQKDISRLFVSKLLELTVVRRSA